MEGNKDESEKCILIALECIASGNLNKARKFLLKAQKLYPSKKAAELLSKTEQPTSNGGIYTSETAQTRHRKHSHSNAQKSSGDHDLKHHTDYTKDQLAAVKRINSCKDMYEVLELSKEFTDSDLKKAYKRLALQMHPDKNKAPGATEAFKAVGKAYSILSDKDKRKQYDLYGPEMQPSRPTRDHQECSRNFEGDISAEELFNMFFGGAFQSANINRRHHSQSRRTFTSQQTEFQSGLTLFLQLAPIMLLVAMSMLSSLLVRDPVFSLQKTEKYRFERKTPSLRVPYYVKDDFREYGSELRRIESAVEEEYIGQLRNSCFRERNYKENMIWRARTYGDAKLYQKAMDLTTPSCDNLQKVYQ